MLKQFFAYYKPYKKLFIIDFCCAVFSALLELGFPLAVNQFVDKLLPSGNWRLILWSCLGLLAVYALNSALQYIVTYWGHKLGINIETDMRRKLFEHVQKLSFRFFDNNKTGTLLSRMTSNLMEIGEMAHHGPEDVFIAVMTLLGAFALMLAINWKLALLTVIVIPGLIFLAMHFNRKMIQAFRRMFRDIGEFNARVEDSIGGIRVVQSFTNEEHEAKLFAHNNEQYRQTKFFSYKVQAQNASASYFLTRMIILFVLVCGTWFVIRGELTSGEFVGFLLLSNVLLGPINKIGAVIESYPKGIAGFKSYLELLETEPDIAEAPEAVDPGKLRGDIRFHDVTFGYEQGRNVISQMSLTIHAGETVALVGPSGAGKTTMLSLLPRFYEVNAGSITVDGIDIRKMKLAALRGQIGIVQQDVFLFSGTIRDNIAYGELDAAEEQIWEAARRARLEEFIRSQPDGLMTVIGERGVKLSGGQKQRLSIARMFLKNPPILILDEATSALDSETEKAIQQSLNELAAGRTTLIIAHRLATIQNADRIIVMTEQGIREQGRHEELLAAQGAYTQLHQAQFGLK
ncbi:Putative multidrug export ATP-binding/permease protein [Paenibacillus konkukensis]|uniref:Multidrug export ATP-binding/permease protein n=1 Tax=Paenibacillus konkukensis TaxID=2020716 RepID=A0ABY4RHS3_9BACL|nr:ABC transporter ATP-binding protein [Paenibacillus konkukensis]UQZ81325.1 Putative multidrug export ATP-binding/permease protein [Paenibacillus konkukensis]